MNNKITEFKILRGMSKNREYGRIEVCELNEWNYGLFFFIGEQHKGFKPVKKGLGTNLAIGIAARLAPQFAKQHNCKYVQRDFGPIRKLST